MLGSGLHSVQTQSGLTEGSERKEDGQGQFLWARGRQALCPASRGQGRAVQSWAGKGHGEGGPAKRWPHFLLLQGNTA